MKRYVERKPYKRSVETQSIFNIHLCSFLAFEFFVLQFYDIVVNNSSKGFMKKLVTGCPPSLIRPLTAVCLACKPALMFGFSFTVPSKGD